MDKNIFENLIGMKFNKIFKQLNLFIINFDKPIKYSLHVACMVRICHDNKIILTASDEFFTKEGMQKSEETYKRLEEKKILVDSNDLLSCNLKVVNAVMKNSYVKNVEVSKWMDLFIYFNNDVVIQIFPDCLEKNYEFYRFIEFIPYLTQNFAQCNSKHFIVLNNEGVFKVGYEKDLI